VAGGAEGRESGQESTAGSGRGFEPGVYRITFDTGAYFQARGVASFYPEVTVTFELTGPGEHYHVPLLLSPFAYSTYRGS
jgi:5-hydroxyisourate hydrolase